MTYSQRILLRRLLPVVFWLLALGGSIGVPFLLETFNLQLPTFNINYWWGFLSAGIVLLAISIISYSPLYYLRHLEIGNEFQGVSCHSHRMGNGSSICCYLYLFRMDS